jgi:sRNA-binding protein
MSTLDKRPILRLKAAKLAPKAEPPKKQADVWDAVRFLAGFDLPLFKMMVENSALLPMAVGIRDSLLAGIDSKRRRKVSRALVTITRSVPYAQALLTDDAKRFDINGAIAEPVSQEHRAGARTRLAGMTATKKGAAAEASAQKNSTQSS